jgi:hypothetical protein
MARLIYDTSMSLDGYITGSHPGPGQPLGERGAGCGAGCMSGCPGSRTSVPPREIRGPDPYQVGS